MSKKESVRASRPRGRTISLGFIQDNIYLFVHKPFTFIKERCMKKFLSLAAVVALSMSMFVATAQEQPKSASKAKSGCCSGQAAKECSDEAKAKKASKSDCGDKSSSSGSKAESKTTTTSETAKKN